MHRATVRTLLAISSAFLLSACVTQEPEATVGSSSFLPRMGWDHRPEASDWTQATLEALEAEGAVLASTVPADIDTFCPGYSEADQPQREAFWAGLLSAVARYESGWNPSARGGGGRWLGLLQIAPATAQLHGCDVSGAEALYDGATNLSCGVRIAATQVGRDGAIVTDGDGGWRGLARDWMPLRNAEKREEIAAFTRTQGYCR
ncbi:transglycosylase SLT domain-containing protein [Ostreiculturibacter nitratireducens]|uniref:transglycosylase SLT domain-containing protein n=1 Tax=Ostreiculturibacter nitratireducens TaxID=3075226 RepID=UPI0031B60A98